MDNNSGSINILLPTLLWEHALAFDQALQRYKNISPARKINVVVLLMFNSNGFDTIRNNRLSLNFTMAFRALSMHSEVQFYASDLELMVGYQRLLTNDVTVGIHPCFLVSQVKQEAQLPKKYIIGYLGDAKKEKGFLKLPELVDNFIESRCEHTLLIHYTLDSACPESRVIGDQLWKKAKVHSNVEVVNEYLSDAKLQSYLSSSVQIILNYDENVYLNKTSG